MNPNNDTGRKETVETKNQLTPEAVGIITAHNARPRLWQFKSGGHFEPGWTGNELIDSRHERDLVMSGAYPAIDVQMARTARGEG